MELIGKLDGVGLDLLTGKSKVIFEVEEFQRVAKEVATLSGVRLRIEVKRYRKKRSRDANAYYWQFLTKLAGALEISNSAMHNILLRRYGTLEQFGGTLVYVYLPDTDEAENQVLESDTYHLKPTSHLKYGKDNQIYRGYQLLKGSSSYNTKEMSRLIDGLISECEQAGLVTLTPDEVKRMMEIYEEKHGVEG